MTDALSAARAMADGVACDSPYRRSLADAVALAWVERMLAKGREPVGPFPAERLEDLADAIETASATFGWLEQRCVLCGDAYFPDVTSVDTRRFCSPSCAARAQRRREPR